MGGFRETVARESCERTCESPLNNKKNKRFVTGKYHGRTEYHHYNMTPSLNEDHCSSHSASMKVIQLGLSRFSNVCEFCANYDFHNSCSNRCHSKFLFFSLVVNMIFIFLSSADNFFRSHS